MTRTLRMLLVGLAALSCLLVGIPAQAGPAPAAPLTVTFPDPGLRQCVANTLGTEVDADPSDAELAAVTSLSCNSAGIEDLTGVQALQNLTSLSLRNNRVSDLAPLSEMTGLQVLTLDWNPITTLAPLRPLVNMRELSAQPRNLNAQPKLTSLDGVQDMTGLTRLVVNNNAITSLEPVSGLTELTVLSMNYSQIRDVTPLANLTKLTQLRLQRQANSTVPGITDVSALSGLTRLTALELANHHLVDVSALPDSLFNVYNVNISRQVVTLPEVPAEMVVTAPRPLNINGSVATPVTAPAGVTVDNGTVTYPRPGSYVWTFGPTSTNGFGGTITQVVGEPVSDAAEIPDSGLRSCLAEAAGLESTAIPTIGDLAGITSADCAGRQITDLTGAELLVEAITLNLADNPIGSLAPLAKLTELRTLDLSGTGLDTVPTLPDGLTTLAVNRNHLADISALGGIETVSATDQTLDAEAVPGGTAVAVPSAVTANGSTVAATITSPYATVQDGQVTYARAGGYDWTFAAGDYTGTITQQVTTDVVDESVHDPSQQCLRSGYVWVVVERDTGLQQGGCATEFDDGEVALASAGFEVTGTGFITAIDGYPATTDTAHYWSYWHATPTGTTDGVTSYAWSYSESAASEHVPQPGTVEGWRYVEFVPGVDAPAPSWVPELTAVPSPTPTPTGPSTSPGTPSAQPSTAPSTPGVPSTAPSTSSPTGPGAPTPSTTGAPRTQPAAGARPTGLPATGR